jgi:hypothetical protein
MVRQSLANEMAVLALAAVFGIGADARTVAIDVPPAFECLRPAPRPLLPDGTFATNYQMDRARDAVLRFNTALRDYRACLQQRLDTAPASIAQARKQEWLTGITASLTEERSLEQEFADQVAKFRMR